MKDPDSRIALRVLTSGRCPALQPDDLMVFEGRGLDLDASTGACIECLCDIYPLVVRSFLMASEDPELPNVQVPCAYRGCGAKFELIEAPDRAIPTPRPVPLAEKGPFMARLPADEAQLVFGAAEHRTFEAGEILIEHGAVGDRLFIVSSGQAEVFVPSPDGDETVLATLGTGECVGEISLLTGSPTTAAVRATTGLKCLTVDRDRLEELLDASPVINRLFTQTLSDRVRRINRVVSDERRAAYRGKLRSVPLSDLLQSLAQTRRNGVMWVLNGDRLARIGLSEGAPTGFVLLDVATIPTNERFQKNAVSSLEPQEAGLEAFYGVLGWEDGDFRFVEGDDESRGEMNVDLMTILIEGARRKDELAQRSSES